MKYITKLESAVKEAKSKLEEAERNALDFGAEELPAVKAGNQPQGYGATRAELDEAVEDAKQELADAEEALSEEEAADKDQVVLTVVCGERRFATHQGYTTELSSADKYSDAGAAYEAEIRTGPNAFGLAGRDEEWTTESAEMAEVLYAEEEAE